MAKLPQTGTQLIVAGAAEYYRELRKASAAYHQTGKEIEGTNSKLGEFAKSAALGAGQSLGLNTAIGILTGGVGALGLAAGSAAIGIGKKLVGAIQEAYAATKRFMQESMQVAGRYAELELVALATARAMGRTRAELYEASETIMEYGIRQDAAYQISAQFMRLQIDLANAQKLTQVAQASALRMGEDSTESMQRLTWALSSGNTMILKRMGLFVSMAKSEEDFAASLGKSREALTQQELMQARVNAVIEAGTAQLDAYDAAMKSPTKVMRSLADRVLVDLKAALGAPFQDAWYQVVKGAYDLATALWKATREGGSLYPIMVRLGAAVSIVTEQLRAGIDWVTQWISGLDSTMSDGMDKIINDALDWGAEIVGNFAEGMIKATSQVLVVAMNAITNLLTGWLKGRSPPKVAPDLVDWGYEAMMQYLHGFTKADFNVLEAIQGPLGKVLSGPAFAGMSEKVIEAISMGNVDSKLFDQIAEAAGRYGTEIADLAKSRAKLVGATNDLADAEKRLDDARKAASSARAKIGTGIREYNEALREGASETELAARMESIRQAEKEADLAQEQITIAEKDKTEAEEKVSLLQEMADVQELLVDQLLKLEAAWGDVAEDIDKALKGAKGAGAGALLDPEDIIPGDWDLVTSMQAAIDEAKAAIKERLGEVWDDLTADAKVAWDAAVLVVTDAWDNMWIAMGKTWEELKEDFPILEKLQTFVEELPEKLDGLGGAFGRFLDDAWKPIKVFWDDHFKDLWESLAGEGGLFDTAKKKAQELADDGFGDKKGGLLGALKDIYDFYDEFFKDIWGKSGLGGEFDSFTDMWLTGWNSMWELFGDLLDIAAKAVDTLAEKLANFQVPQWYKDLTSALWPGAGGGGGGGGGPATPAAPRTGPLDPDSGGVPVPQIPQDTQEYVKNLSAHSLSPFTRGLIQAEHQLRQMNALMRPGAFGAGGGAGLMPLQPITSSPSVTIGPNYFQGSMDEVKVAAIVRDVVRKEFQ